MRLTALVATQTAEIVSRSERREVRILVASPEITVTWSRYAAGERGPDLHVHREHPDAFYVLAGTLTFGVGASGDTVHVGPGGFVAAPPNVPHSFANESGEEASWLNFHAPDCGFASFLRGGTAWDSFDPPADGGRPATAVAAGPAERVMPSLRVDVREGELAIELEVEALTAEWRA